MNFVPLRRRVDRKTGVVLVSIALILLGCQAKTAPVDPGTKSDPGLKKVKVRFDRLRRVMRSNGSIQAVNALTVRVPQIEGQGGNLTLTKLIPGGSEVKTGDVLAEFDRTKQVDDAREAQAKYEDLRHQVDQRMAQHRSDAEKRASDLQQAEADLAKAELELRKGPILSEIDRLKNQAKVEDAQAHVASLKRSGAAPRYLRSGRSENSRVAARPAKSCLGTRPGQCRQTCAQGHHDGNGGAGEYLAE